MAHTVAGRFSHHKVWGVPTETEYPDYRNSKISYTPLEKKDPHTLDVVFMSDDKVKEMIDTGVLKGVLDKGDITNIKTNNSQIIDYVKKNYADSVTINNASVKEKDNIKVKKNDDYER